MSAIDRLLRSRGWQEVMAGKAGRTVASMVRRTPLLPAPALAQAAAARAAFVKAEGLQRTGSFKLRGATARLASLTPSQAEAGVVVASAGNHGLGIAHAAAALGIRATVVVPTISPEVKRSGIAALGAELIVEGEGYDAAESRARAVAEETGATFAAAFDDDHVIAGNGGTVGREILEDLPGGSQGGDAVVVPVGGGGLSAGLCGALAGSGVTLVGVEPEQNCAMSLSFRRGAAVTDYPDAEPTIAEGLEGAVSDRTYRVCREGLSEVALVGDEAMLAAMAWAYSHLGMALEPSAAASLAAVLEGRAGRASNRVVCIVTGSNVDPDLLDSALRTETHATGPGA